MGKETTNRKDSPEIRSRAVRTVLEQEREHPPRELPVDKPSGARMPRFRLQFDHDHSWGKCRLAIEFGSMRLRRQRRVHWDRLAGKR
jgi:hypothetical protein